MPKTSAGLLPYRIDTNGGVEVFVVHMGGPFWARRDAGAWSIAKGEYDAATESAREVAAREFTEEIGVPAPAEPWQDLGEIRQKSGKHLTAYAVALQGQPELAFVESNEFDLEWPRGSGRIQRFPEVDRAEWMSTESARARLVSGQVPLLDRLLELVAETRSAPTMLTNRGDDESVH